MLVFWCRHSARSPHVRDEYQNAIAEHKTVVPVRLDKTGLAFPLKDFQGIDIGRLALLEHQFRRVVVALLLGGVLMMAIGYALPHSP